MNDDLSKMTVSASKLGWTPGEFPPKFFTLGEHEEGDSYWTRKEDTVAENGEIQCVSYQNQNGQWLIVVNE